MDFLGKYGLSLEWKGGGGKMKDKNYTPGDKKSGLKPPGTLLAG